ncbi:MAG: SbcC/MukB-like Walker B domain-containing protein, partial [Loigolactobacillus coryniformis]
LRPTEVSAAVITEACDAFATQRPALEKEVRDRLQMLANKAEIAADDAAFMQAAQEFLDTRRWSEFHVLIKRRQSGVDDFEEVDDKFVRSGGSGAEKAQAMVLPLLLVPKMLLERSGLPDVPYLVMFDEFADKLDPETAKSFAKTIANFGFDFIATMPSGAQNKLLADGVANVAYEVIAPPQQDDGRFYQNQVLPVLSWHEGATDD